MALAVAACARGRLVGMRGHAVGEAAFFASVVPGSTVGLYYKDDPGVRHHTRQM